MIESTKFSVLVVTLNAEKEIVDTLTSISAQSYKNYEVIIKDGMSTDNTLKYIPVDPRYKVIVQKDCSVYDGMNQAIDFATGDFIIFLNAGDAFFSSSVLEEINKFIKANNLIEPCVLYGDYSRGKNCIRYQKKKLNDFFLYRKPLCHQSIFYHKSLIQNYKYDTRYKISADHELTLRLWKNNIPFIHTEQVICQYLGGGISETSEGMRLAIKEKREAILKHYSKKEILKYDLIMKMSFSKIREWILSQKSPEILRNTYKAIINRTSK